MPQNLEVAVFSSASALQAQSSGAGRIELNASQSYPAGGTTPPIEVFRSLSPQMTIPVRLMIRPRGPPQDGTPDFIYTHEELQVMKRDLTAFVKSGLLNQARGDGFVFGILKSTATGHLQVDSERCSELVQLAGPFPCVFHRAFDPIAATSDWHIGLNDLELSGFRGLLTAGGVGNMGDNLPRLGDIAKTSHPKGIEVVAGGGLRARVFSNEVSNLITKADHRVWLHTAALLKDKDGLPTEEVDANELGALLAKMAQ